MSEKRKLAERVEWVKLSRQHPLTCFLGGVTVTLWTVTAKHKFEVEAIGPYRKVLKSRTLHAAKAEALRIVQAAVLAAAEAWRD